MMAMKSNNEQLGCTLIKSQSSNLNIYACCHFAVYVHINRQNVLTRIRSHYLTHYNIMSLTCSSVTQKFEKDNS